MKKISLVSYPKYFLFCALASIGFIFVNSYIQPTYGSVIETESSSTQLPENTIHAELDTPFELELGQTALVNGSESLKIKFLRVPVDSRCPVNISCFQPGEILIVLGVSIGDRTVTNFNFGYGLNCRVYNRDFEDYTIKLLDIKPVPEVDLTLISKGLDDLKKNATVETIGGFKAFIIDQPLGEQPQPENTLSRSPYVVKIVVSKKSEVAQSTTCIDTLGYYGIGL